MVMIFEHPAARRQLLEKGIVYTFRGRRHKEGPDWANAGYRGSKIADIEVLVVADMYPASLSPWVQWSGFPTLTAWIEAIRDFGIDPEKRGWLHEVRRVRR